MKQKPRRLDWRSKDYVSDLPTVLQFSDPADCKHVPKHPPFLLQGAAASYACVCVWK